MAEAVGLESESVENTTESNDSSGSNTQQDGNFEGDY